MTIEVFNTVLFWVGIAVITYYSPLICRYYYTKIFCKGMSNMRTAPEIGRKAAEIIRVDMQAKGYAFNGGCYTVLDLGSAWGYLSCDLAEQIPEAKFIGMDCDPGGVKFSNMQARRRKIPNAEFIVADFFEYDISKADAIIFYLPDTLMQKMGERLKAHAHAKALIISNRFQLLAGWEPAEVLMVETKFPRQGRLNIYRKA